MKENTKANPATIVIMLMGIAVAVFVIIHSLPAAMAPIATQDPLQHTKRMETPNVTTSPNTGAVEVTKVTFTEAQLAPEADPFTPIAGMTPSAVASKSAVNAGSVTIGPALPTGVPPGTSKSAQVNSKSLAPFSIQEPELVGTLLGDRPSALFRIDQKILSVSLGGDVIGWKVISIQQGVAVLRGMGKTVRVYTGRPQSGGGPVALSTVPAANVAATNGNTAITNVKPESISETGHITVTEVEVPAGEKKQTVSEQASSSVPNGATEPSPGAISSTDPSEETHLVQFKSSEQSSNRSGSGNDAPTPARGGDTVPEMPAIETTRTVESNTPNTINPVNAMGRGPKPHHTRRRHNHKRVHYGTSFINRHHHVHARRPRRFHRAWQSRHFHTKAAKIL